ncbi:MAG: hypothetical protein ACK5OQ_16370 [Burkholderiales bacterium]|jgi:hypothetical protein
MNLFKVFKSLIPEPPLQVGDVIATDNGTVLIELPGGGILQARGDAMVGDRVFVRDGVIEGPAPTLPVEIISV